MKFYNRRFLLIINVIIILFFLYFQSKRHKIDINEQPNINKPLHATIPDESVKKMECYRHIDISNSSVNLPKHAECKQKDWVRITDNGTLLYNFEILKQLDIKIKKCTYTKVTWFKNDFDYKIADPIEISNNQKIDSEIEFFIIKCTSKGSLKYLGPFQRIFKPKIEQKLKKEQPINVFMLGADSISRELWLTLLPKTSHFLMDQMNSTILNAYNIVGDGTPAALIPILTSKHEHELPSTLKTDKNAKFVDLAYPFIWNNFSKELDYATLFNEEWPHVGSFTYRMKGMSKPPTDHYPRPYYTALRKLDAQSQNGYCAGGRTDLQFVLDYSKDFMQTYKKSGFFGFEFLAQYSHDSSKHISWMDDELVKFLEEFKADESISSNTILVLFGDHGPRFSKLRKSIKGLIQERNAFFSVYLPPLFKSRYPNEYENLKANNDKLATPMDIHATLMNLINLEKGSNEKSSSIEKRDKSLFSKLSVDRTCDEAGIEPHYCACMKRTQLKPDGKLTKLANKFVIYINEVMLKNHNDICQKLELNKIDNVYLLETSINTAKKRIKTNEHKNFELFKSLNLLKAPKIEIDYKKYLFQITTSPNSAYYEFTITIESKINEELNLDNIKIDKDTISRLNAYGSTADCVKVKFPDLRKYCYCK